MENMIAKSEQTFDLAKVAFQKLTKNAEKQKNVISNEEYWIAI